MIEQLWYVISSAFSEAPAWFGAIVFGWGFSWGLTQSIKFFIPYSWSAERRKITAQMLGFVTAAAVVLAVEPLKPLPTALLAVMTGLWSPLSWGLLMAVLRKRWPFLADVLTQDVRGVLFGERKPAEEPKP